jgi:hypothetical protein
MTVRTTLFMSLALLLSPALARADGDAAGQAFEQISGAVYQGVAERIQTFVANPLTDLPESQKRAAPPRKGIDFHQDGVRIRNIPRMSGNRFVEIEIPADGPDSNGRVPTFLLWAERKDPLHGDRPSVNVRIPVGRKGDWPLNVETTKTGTRFLLGRTPITQQQAHELLSESGFRPRGMLPKEAHAVIETLGRVQGGVPALNIAKGVLGRGNPTRTGKTR